MADHEFWFNNSNQNLLKGVEGDEDNPPMLDADFIMDFFARIPSALQSYQRIRPSLLVEEQERLDGILQASIMYQKLSNNQQWLDQAMTRHNTAGIHLERPRRT